MKLTHSTKNSINFNKKSDSNREITSPLQLSSRELTKFKISSRNTVREEKRADNISMNSFTKPILRQSGDKFFNSKASLIDQPESILHRLRTENDVKEPYIKNKILRSIHSITYD
jgi:hypothetical protein